jgi:hypothetical protein
MQMGEFIDNSLTAMMHNPPNKPAIMDIYVCRELTRRGSAGISAPQPNKKMFSWVAYVDSGKGMGHSTFQDYANRGAAPLRKPIVVRYFFESYNNINHNFMPLNECGLGLVCW